MTYFDKLAAQRPKVIAELEARGIDARHLGFGGAGEANRRVNVPNDAQSEFLANRAMGDWAENVLADGLTRVLPRLSVVHYGDSDLMSAGEKGFPEFYKSRLEDVRINGKRPDLLVVPSALGLASNVSRQATAELAPLVRQARMAVEVRSSKYEALEYMRVRAEQKSQGNKGGRDTPSFTVKVEDLKVVYRWIEKHDVDQVYCQVFFDSVFAINFLDIFGIVAQGGSGFKVEKPHKSQKATITISIKKGVQIGSFDENPSFEVERRRTPLGRHDVYVRPVRGRIIIDADTLRGVCADPTTLR